MNKYSNLKKEFLYNEHWNKNKTLHQIARENNIAKGSVNYVFKNLGIKVRSNKETNILLFKIKLDESKLVNLYVNKKLTLEQIAKKHKISKTTVFNILKKLKVKFRRNREPWNKGNKQKYYCIDCKEEVTRKQTKRCSECNGIYFSNTFTHTKATKSKLSILHGGNGDPYSNNSYGEKFTNKLKRKIRASDNFTCQLCGMSEAECKKIYKRVLDVHHIDYNKKNSKDYNLTSLCRECHRSTNHNRSKWQMFFQKRKGN